MTEPIPLDRLRDLLDGRLAPAEVDALRAEIAADASIRADFDALREVHELTRFEPTLAASSLTASDVLRAAAAPTHSAAPGRVLRLNPWMAAAAVLVAVAAGVSASLVRPVPREVALAVLSAPRVATTAATTAGADAASAPALPAELADYAPVRDGAPQWAATWDEGVAISLASARPIFAYVYFADCPYCHELDGKTFADAGVQADLAEFVPVRLDVTKLAAGDPLLERLPKGWPYLAALRVDGSEIFQLAGRWELADVAPQMHRAVEESRRLVPEQPTWDGVRAAARSVIAAESALAADRSGDAWTGALSAERAAPTSGIASRAALIRRDVRARAQRALDDAAAGSASAPERAAALEKAARDFAGSPFGDDLAAVARAVRETGLFPVLSTPGGKR
ncbi:MAG: thioredoxin family protein [Planctomycetes bacterium]|nr:thioredoxin family protein [Planctomycetota bacterium]